MAQEVAKAPSWVLGWTRELVLSIGGARVLGLGAGRGLGPELIYRQNETRTVKTTGGTSLPSKRYGGLGFAVLQLF